MSGEATEGAACVFMSTASALNSPGSGADDSKKTPPSEANNDKLAVGVLLLAVEEAV